MGCARRVLLAVTAVASWSSPYALAAELDEALAACDRRAAAWSAFGTEAASIDWSDPGWARRSQALMQRLWDDGESDMRACPTPTRFWTDAAFTTVTVSFALHQPPRVPGYGAKLQGLVDEIVANIRHQQQLLRDGKVPLPAPRQPPEDVDPDELADARAGGTPAGPAPGLASTGGLLPLSAAALLQSVPPHCVPKALPDVPDCADERNAVDDAYACWVDNLNDIAKYERWSEEQWKQAKGDLGNVFYDAAGIPLKAGAALVHAGGGFVSAATSGDAAGTGLSTGGVVAATVETAGEIGQAAAASSVGAVLTALQIQGNVMMFLLHDAGRAQGNFQAKMARIRAGKCHTRYVNATLALNRCMSERMDAQLRREMVELDNELIALDPSCNPPPPDPPAPDPAEEERKRLERERVERLQKEAAERLARQDVERPGPPPPPDPSDPFVMPPDYDGRVDSFFDVFYALTIDDVWTPTAEDGATREVPTMSAESTPQGGGGKKILIGGGAAALIGAVAVAGGGGGDSSPPAANSGPGSTTPPPTVSLGVSPNGTGMANLTGYTFTGTGTATTFTWNFGDGSTASGATVTHVFGSPGTFTVTLTGQSGSQSATASTSVSVAPDMTGAWAGPFNNRDALVVFNPAAGQVRAHDLAVTGTYQDQFDNGSISGTLSGNGVCPCELRFSISIPGVPTFEWVGQRVDANTLVGSFQGQGFSTATTLTRQ